MNALGYLPDPPKLQKERPDFDAAVQFARAPQPASVDLRHLVVEVLDQGSLGSCVAQSALQALRMRDRAVRGGSPAPALGSRLFAYFASRAAHGAIGYDTGTNFRSMFGGLAKLGVPPESAWPYDPSGRPGAPFSKMPPSKAFRLAIDARRPIEYLRVYDTGSRRLDMVRRALGAGHPVCFGMDVTQDFVDDEFEPELPLGPLEGDTVGGHAMLLVGYEGTNFRVLNSWGQRWGDGGTCLVSGELVIEQARDLWIVSAGAAL